MLGTRLCVMVVNFDIIHLECRGDKLIGDYKDYKTIKTEDLSRYPKKEAEVVLSAAFRNKKDDLWVKQDLIVNILGRILNKRFCNFIRKK